MANRQTPNQLVKTFQRLCHEYLKPQERERLVLSLKRFERSRDVVELAETMVSILDTPEKSSALYPVLNDLIPASCRKSYQEILQKKLSPEDHGHLQKNMQNGTSGLPSQDNSAFTDPVETSNSNTISLQKVIHLGRSPKDGTNVGFRLCYSDISGTGYFINSLEQGFAERTDLEVGDKLVAINDIPVHNWQMTADQLLSVVAGQRQQSVGVDIHIRRLMFNPQKLTTGGSCSVQDICWYDIADMKFYREHKPKWPSQLRHTRMKMQDSTTGRMGLNIRGGREFSCGVYISKIERGGLAERCGLKVGDQILTVNGISLIDVPYRLACRHMAYEDTLDFVVRYTGQFPIYTETPKNQTTDRTPEDRNLRPDSDPNKPTGMNYPYSNGRVDPIGSCSPGTTHGYKKSSPFNEDQRQKGLITDTPCIQNPLCSDESPLLNPLPNIPSSARIGVKTPEINQSNTPKVDWSEIPPKPPPRTGKPDLEKLNQILSKKNEAAIKHNQPPINCLESSDSQTAIVNQSVGDATKHKTLEHRDFIKPDDKKKLKTKAPKISPEGAGSKSSRVEVETTAIVHQSAEDEPEPETLTEEFSKPVDQKSCISKPPRKHKKTVEINECDVKSEPESRNKITKSKLQTHQGLNTVPGYTEGLKIGAKGETIIKPESVERLEHAKPEPITKKEYSSIPSIVVEPENVTVPGVVVESERDNTESSTDVESVNKPINFIKAECTVELELLSIHPSDSPVHDDDDRLSYISSVSMEYDGDHFIMKSPPVTDEDDDISQKDKSSDLIYTEDEAPINRNSVMYKVRLLEGKHVSPNPSQEKNANRRQKQAVRDVHTRTVPLMTAPANAQTKPPNRHTSGHRSTFRPSKMDLGNRSGSLAAAPATKDIDVIDETLAEDDEGSTGLKEHIPMSSALFRLSWISDDSDSDDTGPTEPVSLLPEKQSEPLEVVVPSVTTPVAKTPSPSLSPIPSSQNSMERGKYSKSKRRSEESRFPNAVVRTMNNLAATREEDAENNQFQMLKKMASFILNKEEIKSIMQYVREYLERNDVEQLVSRLLEVLNNPEKHLLLNQIRELVSPFDRGRFDSMLSVHENINFQKSEYREIFNDKGERGSRPSLKEEQSLLARVQCRRKQLDAQMELLEHLRKAKPKIYKHKEEDLNLITVYVSKNVRTLGISVTGGADCKKQQALIIEEVHSGGAAAETKRIKPGMTLVSVDDEDIETASHKAAVYTIRKAFTDRKKPYMKLVLRKPVDVERWPTS